MTKKVIFDTDGGGDDLWALLLLLDAHKRGDIELVGITTCFGNTSLENATNNVLNFLYYCGINNVPVFAGNSLTLEGRKGLADNAFGTNGLSKGTLPNGDLTAEKTTASDFIKQHLSGNDPVSIIATGPLTNLAEVFQKSPDLDRDHIEILWMGGAIFPADGAHKLIVKGHDENGHPIYNQGNITELTEFNCANDALAASIITSLKNASVTIFPMDPAQNTDFDNAWQADFIKTMEQDGHVDIAKNLIAFLQNVIALDQMKQGMEGTPIYDLLTVLYFLNKNAKNPLDIFPRETPLSNVQIVDKGHLTPAFVEAKKFSPNLLENHGNMAVTPVAKTIGHSNIKIIPGPYTFTDEPSPEEIKVYIEMGERRKKTALNMVGQAIQDIE